MAAIKTRLIMLITACLPLLACAQAGQNRLRYFNITQFGFLQGQHQQTYSVQTINGVSWKKFNAGLGIAFDNYGYTSAPIFADMRYNLLNKKKTALQVYGDAGINAPVKTGKLPEKYSNGNPWNTMHISFYSEAGISYSVNILRRLSFVAGLGYNYKTFKYTETAYTGDIGLPEQQFDYTYHYGKYVVRLGFGF